MDEREILAREWFDRGDNDLRSAQHLLTMPDPPYENIGFHAQQCAEKYLKGFLLYHGIRSVSYTHLTLPTKRIIFCGLNSFTILCTID